MTDSWIRLCERVDALLNRGACQTALDTPADVLKRAEHRLQELESKVNVEALDQHSTIEATVLQLEEAADDQKLLNDVLRQFHTLKGNAGALGVKSVQEFAHKVENLLALARSGTIQMGAAAI